MNTEITALDAAIQCKCPRCRKGKMFKYKLLAFKSPLAVEDKCSVCNLKYEIEPGFFWGAMYFSYAFSVGMFLILSGIIYFIDSEAPFWVYITTIVISTLLTSPLFYRYARVLMLHMFGEISYNPNYIKATVDR